MMFSPASSAVAMAVQMTAAVAAVPGLWEPPAFFLVTTGFLIVLSQVVIEPCHGVVPVRDQAVPLAVHGGEGLLRGFLQAGAFRLFLAGLVDDGDRGVPRLARFLTAKVRPAKEIDEPVGLPAGGLADGAPRSGPPAGPAAFPPARPSRPASPRRSPPPAGPGLSPGSSWTGPTRTAPSAASR